MSNRDSTLYDTDFYGWVQQQAALIQQGRWGELDAANVQEELESLGRSEKRALTSQIARLCCHLLKWRYQPARRSRSWVLSIRGARQDITTLLRDNPSLKGKLDEVFADGYGRGRLMALEETGLSDGEIPEIPPFDLEGAMALEIVLGEA
ncbi:DUF29 domain-containing protein [Leptolyngbya sp. PCC 6406]|uniref:DUF29 domain-containing protein n=1 Tax=Leptolyngbya sp. PCC 6406 TaxID=1173264 RepID=UPI0002AC92CD|nr:DUF29 domain-containing protein [Leptolyngbya sp. PCC 6406]